MEYWECRQQLADRCACEGALCTARRSPAIPGRGGAAGDGGVAPEGEKVAPKVRKVRCDKGVKRIGYPD